MSDETPDSEDSETPRSPKSYDPRTGNNTAAYNRMMWQKNKSRLNERRKSRYHTDPEFRQRVKDSVKKSRARKKRAAQVRQERTTPRAQRSGSFQLIELPNGTEVEVLIYTISQLAHRVGVALETVRKWERQNVIPGATYHTPGGQRRYTTYEVDVVKEVYAKHKMMTDPWRLTTEFIGEIQDRWNALDHGVDPEVVLVAQEEG